MKPCNEFAVFRVVKENISRAIELSEAIFLEMNTADRVITTANILVNTDNPEEICWHLEWVNVQAAKATTEKWPTFPSTTEFQSMVVNDIYYGHFVSSIQAQQV